MAKRASAVKVKDEGRFLCVENRTHESWSFKHPDPKNNGMLDLYVPPFETVVCSSEWLDVPYFANAIADGAIRTFRTDVAPRPQDFSVPRELDLSEDSTLNRLSIIIVSSDFNDRAKAWIKSTAESRGTDVPDKEYLKGQFTKFLKNIEYREKRFRSRDEVLNAVRERISEINAM